MIGQFANGMIALMLAKFMLNDVPHLVYGNPGNPVSSTTEKIISRSGLKEYEYRWFPPPEEEAKPRRYASRRVKNISHYSVVMTRTDNTCTVRLYEFLEGWRRKLRATWTGFGKEECDRKFDEVCDAVKQAVLEEKTAMMR